MNQYVTNTTPLDPLKEYPYLTFVGRRRDQFQLTNSRTSLLRQINANRDATMRLYKKDDLFDYELIAVIKIPDAQAVPYPVLDNWIEQQLGSVL